MVRTPQHTILLDTCVGNHKDRPAHPFWNQLRGEAYMRGLAALGLTVDDIDLFEINEAFAVVAEKFIRDLKLDRDKVNVNGGACALGHPIGASGARIMVTLMYALKARGLTKGLATLCIGGGQGVAIVIEC